MRLTRDSEKATDVLTEKKIGKLLKKPKGEKVNFGLDDVQTEVKRLGNRIMTLKNKAIVKVDTNVENIGLKVDKIEVRTQSLEKMVEQFYPTLNETLNLLRETRWEVGTVAKAVKSEIQTNVFGSPKQGTNGIPIPTVGGGRGDGGYMKWEKITIFITWWRAFTQANKEGRTGLQYHKYLPPDPSVLRTRDLRGHQICKTPINYDLLRNTGININ